MAETRIANKFGTVTGTTTASYVEILHVDLRGCGQTGKFVAKLKNTGASNSIYYKIDYLIGGENSISAAGKAETSIAAAGTAAISTTEVPYNCIVIISVVNNAGASTYQLDWTTY
jgi:hypothetical protein